MASEAELMCQTALQKAVENLKLPKASNPDEMISTPYEFVQLLNSNKAKFLAGNDTDSKIYGDVIIGSFSVSSVTREITFNPSCIQANEAAKRGRQPS